MRGLEPCGMGFLTKDIYFQLDSELGVIDDGYNWKSIVLSLFVIGLFIAGIVTAIYLLGYVDELLYWSGRRMALDEYLRVSSV